ncbi:MAG: HAD hydrolase-like protein, partial [Chromatiaceae bacterium]|nr:HAD hydrolase-like protein [Chromatiaceae bacterium]
GRVGLTAGALAAMLGAIIRERWADQGIGFVRLGQPAPALFEIARRQLGVTRLVMLGDQLATDIAGARAAGIDAVLVGTGLAPASGRAATAVRPTWVLPSLGVESSPAAAARTSAPAST